MIRNPLLDRFLKIYSVLFALLMLPAYFSMSERHPTLFDIIDMPISIIATVGFLCYAFRFHIANGAFWRVWFYLAIVWDFSFNFVISWHFHLGQNMAKEPWSLGSLMMGYLLFLPEYYALYHLRYMDDEEEPGADAEAEAP